MALIRLALGVLHALPRGAVCALGTAAGGLYGRLSKRRRAIALENLERAFGPAMSPARRRAIVRSCFRHFGRVTFETLILDRCRPSDAGTLFTYEGLENARAAYARGKGVFLFTAHYGNWEIAGIMQGFLGLPLALITRPLDNAALEEVLFRKRSASGNLVIGKRHAVRHILRALAEGKGIAILIDQNVRSGARVFVDYFGTPAATTPTLALLALKTGAPIIPVFSVPGPRGRYHIVYGEEVSVPHTGDRDHDVLLLTQECTRLIEEQVRRTPECWLWMHERWKSRPRRGEQPR